MSDGAANVSAPASSGCWPFLDVAGVHNPFEHIHFGVATLFFLACIMAHVLQLRRGGGDFGAEVAQRREYGRHDSQRLKEIFRI